MRQITDTAAGRLVSAAKAGLGSLLGGSSWLVLLAATSLFGCDGSGGGSASGASDATPTPAPIASPPTPAPIASPPAATPTPPGEDPGLARPGQLKTHGRFVGSATIDGTEHFVDALVSEDGVAHVYIGDAGGVVLIDSGVFPGRPASGSLQFVGRVHVMGDNASGIGQVLAQGCADPQAGQFCGAPRSAELSLAAASDGIAGELRVRFPEGDETWTLDLMAMDNYYVLPAWQGPPAGQFAEEFAEFAPDGDTVLNVDSAGRLLFQSPHSGCTGTGEIKAHGGGRFNVYDVVLRVEACRSPYAHLNGEYEGLATTSPSSAWAYDGYLRMWLVKLTGEPAALTTWGRWI